MSLILEALKKLERDRHTHERGFLVLGQPAWTPAVERHWTRGPALLGAAALAGAAVAAAVLWSPRAPQTPVPAAVAAPDVRAPAAPAHLPAAAAPSSTPARPAAPLPRVVWPPEKHAAAGRLVAPSVNPAAPQETPADPAPAEPVPSAREADVEKAASEAEPPSGEPPPVTGPLRLEAIAQRDGQPVAVVSGQLVRVGDRLGAGTVVRIGVAEIEIETDGVRRILRF